MTQQCCASCRVRFPRSAPELAPCPICGAATITLAPESAIGFRLHAAAVPETLVAAVAVRVPAHDPAGLR
jgi:hypothetical protein